MKRKLPKLWQLKRFIQWGYKSSGYPKRLDCFELLGFAQQFKRSKKQSHIFPADSLKDAFYRENITSHRQRIQLLIMGFMPTRLPRLLGRLGKCEKNWKQTPNSEDIPTFVGWFSSWHWLTTGTGTFFFATRHARKCLSPRWVVCSWRASGLFCSKKNDTKNTHP